MADFLIKMRIDNSEAQQAAAAGVAGLGRMQAASKQAATAMEADFKGVADSQIGWINKVLTAEEVAQQAMLRRIHAANEQRIKAAESAAKGEIEGFEGARSVGELFLGTLTSVGAQFASMNFAIDLLRGIVEEFGKMNESLGKSASLVTDYRESLLEVAALKGELGETGTALKQDILFRAKTGQSREESKQFQMAALGAGESFISDAQTKRRISQSEFTRLMEMAGGFQAVERGAPETHGQLAGMIPFLMKQKGEVSAEQAFAKEQQLYNIFKPGGASFTSLTNQFLRQAPLAGLYGDPAQLAALTSMFSLTNKEGAGEMTQQFTRATVGGLGRMRGMPGVEGQVTEKQAQYLKRVGATDQMDPIQIGQIIARDIVQQEAESAKRGEKLNKLTYLQSKGYINQEDIRALIAFQEGQGQWTGKFEPLARQVPSPDQAGFAMRMFQQGDPVAGARKAKLAEDMAAVSSAGANMEFYNNLMNVSFQNLKAKGQAYGTKEEFTSGLIENVTGAHRMAIERTGETSILRQARALGIPIPPEMLQRIPGTGANDPAARARELGTLAGKIRERGQDPLEALMKEIADLSRRQLESQERTEQAIRDGQKPAAGPKPVGPAPPLNRPKPRAQPIH